MGWQFISAAGYDQYAQASIIDCSSALNIQEGDLLVAIGEFIENVNVVSIAETGGGNSMTLTSRFDSGSQYGIMGYKIGAVANASATFRLTLSAPSYKPTIGVLQFRPDSGDTVSLDSGPNDNIGTGTTAQSDNFDTTGIDELVVAGRTANYQPSPSGAYIGEESPDGTYLPGGAGGECMTWMWYKIFTATKTGIHAQSSLDSSIDWLAMALAFKAVAGGGGGWTEHKHMKLVF
jgi:hypothetical protein